MIQADPAPQVEGPYPLSTLRHSVAHLMASAVQKLFPGAQFGFGPSIEHGFYYDVELPDGQTRRDAEARVEPSVRVHSAAHPRNALPALTRRGALAVDLPLSAVESIAHGAAAPDGAGALQAFRRQADSDRSCELPGARVGPTHDPEEIALVGRELLRAPPEHR